MWIADLIFGARPPRRLQQPLLIEYAPKDANWRRVRPRYDADPVRAWCAETDSVIVTDHGELKVRGGRDMIVTQELGHNSVVRADVFDRTYESLGGGLYRKRHDLVLRYFTLDRPALVRTLEGEQHAEAGDWIMEGVIGELWPIDAEEAERKYRPA
jgi:hypothetical protein